MFNCALVSDFTLTFLLVANGCLPFRFSSLLCFVHWFIHVLGHSLSYSVFGVLFQSDQTSYPAVVLWFTGCKNVILQHMYHAMVPFVLRPGSRSHLLLRSHVRTPWSGPIDNLDRFLRGRGCANASAFLSHCASGTLLLQGWIPIISQPGHHDPLSGQR